ncbi:MAG TPA: hybrid sensor histidine kinase/response regulator [Candidatus Binatia bacterium]|jgi:signal transduction histidine kinase|nr:hybrid sensor histidine kinase/response regulator [Candidatus Binatia bacterium]
MTSLPRVLIVDDELGVRESLRAILGSDYDIMTAGSGDEALGICAREAVDLVTLDLRMPGMGGISVLEAIKKIDPEIEVLIITGYGSFDTAIQGLRNRAFDYLSKPFDCDHVRHVVQAALARRTALRRLRSAPEQILATLSHEFRTPLNVIMGYSTMMGDEQDAPLSQEQKLALDRIQANSSALLSYVETLFYMVELDRGLIPLNLGPVHIANVLVHVQGEVASAAAQKGVTVAIDVPTDLVVTSDEDKITRLVRSLADNAVRYSPSGQVVLAARSVRDQVVLEVRDSGGGISPELVAETQDVIAGRPGADPPRLLGFGLRLAGRLVRVLGAGLAITAGRGGTTCEVTVPTMVSAELPRIASNG